MKKNTVLIAVAVAASVILAGCSKKVSVEEGNAKIAELAAKGVPERYMSSLKMYLYHMETAKRTGNNSQFRLYQDSLTTELADFESRMDALLAETGPFMDSLRRVCDEKLAALKGLHLKEAEVGKGPVDSLMRIESQKLRARDLLETWALELDTIVMKQSLADSLRGRFVGTWITESAGSEDGFSVVERKEIHKGADGSLLTREGRIAKSGGRTVEDWLFQSRGTWDLYGDVAYHTITRDKRVRQIIGGKSEQPFDSAVTKSDAISWEALNKEYKWFKYQPGRW